MSHDPACAGTVLNYFLDQGLNKATILFPGVACFAMAVIAGALTHIFNEQYLGRRQRMLDASHHGHAVGNAVVGFEHGSGDSYDMNAWGNSGGVVSSSAGPHSSSEQ